jgi:hypothetical protein
LSLSIDFFSSFSIIVLAEVLKELLYCVFSLLILLFLLLFLRLKSLELLISVIVLRDPSAKEVTILASFKASCSFLFISSKTCGEAMLLGDLGVGNATFPILLGFLSQSFTFLDQLDDYKYELKQYLH